MTKAIDKASLFFSSKALRAAILCTSGLLLSGCIPGSDDDNSSFKATLSKFVGSEGEGNHVNRSGKNDALLRLKTVDEIGQDFTSSIRSVRQSGEQVVSLERPLGVGGQPRFQPLPNLEPISLEAALSDFYAALHGLETGNRKQPVTIVHFGDQQIAADRFSGDLREQFQSRFGRAALGFLNPAVKEVRGIRLDRGGSWRFLSSAEGSAGIYGISGIKASTASADAWMRLTATDTPFEWVDVTLETGPKFGTAIVSVDGAPKVIATNAPTSDWKTVRINRRGREVTIRARGDGEIRVHSITIGDDKPGVQYVSLGLPKATALTVERWSPGLVAADLKRLDPKLVVISYGTVEGFDDTLNIAAYEQRLLQAVAQIKTAAPEASLIIIGPPDAARMPAFAVTTSSGMNACRALNQTELLRYERLIHKGDVRLARWHAPPKLHEVRETLRRVAAHVKAYYWDWSKIMGGPCGIHAWVHSNPPLAAPDHIMLTAEGARRSARAFYNEILSGYKTGAPVAQKR
jgi:hypothetical protein